ncbi:hypothetical protein Ae201684P_003166 [Aphanomyces euteiches]|nr:hypothetical protein Ae201684P_003166 [Aphanomyces euteiches]
MPPRRADQTKPRVGNQRQDEKSTSKRVLWTKDAVADGKTNDVMRDRASTVPLLTSDNIDDNDESDGTRTPEQKKISNSEKKRSANVAKLNEWVDINSRVYDLKRDQFQFTRDVESRKLEVNIQREARLAEETKINIRLLTIQADEAQWKFEHSREMAEVAARIKKIEIRRELKEKGWTDSEIDQACPI